MKYDLNFYTKVYDNFLETEICEEYIKLYEETLEQESDVVKKNSLCYTKEGEKICKQCTCQRLNTMEHDRFKSINKIMLRKFQSAVARYKIDCKIHKKQWPERHGWEQFKVKRYLVSDGGEHADQFKYHIDVDSQRMAKRFLVVMVYLNDDFEKGETIFPIFGDVVKPKKGRLLMFPPYWTYLHAGLPATKPGYAKYFLGTYLTYE